MLSGWAGLLSPKHLSLCNRQMKEMCSQCSISGRNDSPFILSACLISMEPHSTLHVMPDSIKTQEERMSSKIQMDTPRDASCTHILVVPNSSHAQANSGQPLQTEDINLANEEDDDFISGMLGDTGMGEGMDDMDISDILGGLIGDHDPCGGDNQMNQSNEAGGFATGRQSPMFNNRQQGADAGADPQDETNNLSNQPLAMGYYTSTAKTGVPLPKWFWASCPHREHLCPTCLKVGHQYFLKLCNIDICLASYMIFSVKIEIYLCVLISGVRVIQIM